MNKFEPKPPIKVSKPPQVMVTIRMTEELHLSLKHAACKSRISLNKLCIDMMEHCLDSMKEPTNE